MKILVRIYVPQKDKTNITVNTIDEALKILGKSLDDVYLKHDWLNLVDLYFVGTNNYIRITN
jgi:hypothetical protein